MGRRLRRRRRVLLDLGGAEPRVSARLAGPARVLGHPGVLITSRARTPPAGVRVRHDPRAAPCRQPSSVAVPLQREAASGARGSVVPFFEERPLRTAKRADFEQFVTVLEMMGRGEHLREDGLRRVASITETMNRRQRSRFLESSEAIRQPALTDGESKIWS
jgi:hypothetical protein